MIAQTNDRWAHIIWETCLAHGVHDVILCPGARSTAMAVALYNLSETKRVRVFTHYDERGAAFYALGIAKATGAPVAIVTTSGTAVANLLPALVEAQKSQTPLVVLSCDRPAEEIFSGANQTIEQSQLLSASVAYSHTLPAPSPEISESSIAYTVAHAVAHAVAKHQPIHINCPFREPLSENPLKGVDFTPPNIVMGKTAITIPEHALDQLRHAKRGVVLAGNGVDAAEILAIATTYHWPIIPDVCSPLRYLEHPLIITHADLLAAQKTLGSSDCMVHIGDPMTGRNIASWAQTQTASYIRIHHRDDYGDPISEATYIGIGEIPSQQLLSICVNASQFTIPKDHSFLRDYIAQQTPEYRLFHHWDNWLPKGWGLFLGNSQPIRQIGEIAAASTRPLMAIGSNRGASGIDGLIATSGGFMTGYDRPGALILGDLSFLHDVSSLPLVAHQPLLIIVIQNNGGEIFSRFSVKEHPCFDSFFHLTHTHSCADAATWALGYAKRVPISEAELAIHDATDWIATSGSAALLELVIET